MVLSSPSKIAEYGQSLLDGHRIGDKDLIALSGLDDYEGAEIEEEGEEQDEEEAEEAPESAPATPASPVTAPSTWF
ncbi:hypothetical protein D3C84_913550 [compost metagenome]